jgi:hypothetical protein
MEHNNEIKKFTKDISAFVSDQLEKNPTKVDDYIKDIGGNEEIQDIMELILSIEKCKKKLNSKKTAP